MQTNGKTRMTRWFLSWGLLGCHQASPHCIDRSLGGSAANWHHLPSPHVGRRKNLPTSEGSSITYSTRVALSDSHWVSTIPHHNHFSRAPHNLPCMLQQRPPPRHLGGGNSKSNKHHLLATRTLVPLDAISQCNALESLIRNRIVLLQA